MKSFRFYTHFLVLLLTLFCFNAVYSLDTDPNTSTTKATSNKTNKTAEDVITQNKNEQNTVAENTLTPAEALDRLMLGNQRFVENHMACPVDNPNRRIETAEKQTPFAIILGCSDSRVSPELTFSQGVGDIFVVRIAGNTVSPIALDSIEYSVIHNHSVIIIVLGHENCGAVDAVFNNNTKDIPDVAKLIQPVVNKVKKLPNPTIHDAIIANIQNSVAAVKASPVIQKYMQENKVMVRGAYYHLASGQVELFKD